MIAIEASQPIGDAAANVAAMGEESLVAEHIRHQLRPEVCYRRAGHAGLGRARRKAKAGERRRDHIEGILRAAAMGRRVGQERNDLFELHDARRPAMGDDKRQRPGTLSLDMQDMDRVSVHIGHKLGKGVEPGFGQAPVETVPPMRDEALQEIEIGAIAPPGAVDGIGPAGAGEPCLEVGDVLLGDGDFKGCGGHGCAPCRLRSPPMPPPPRALRLPI